MSYTVSSDRLVGKKKGDTVERDALEAAGVNVEALLAAGHIRKKAAKAAAKKGN